jgi:hypothetical protein
MSKGNSIIVSAQPRGVFKEGYIVGTPKPGTLVVRVPAQTAVDDTGSWNYEPAGTTGATSGLADAMTADGDTIAIGILLEDALQAKLMTDAYVTGDRCRIYYPLPGEEVNVLFQNQSGTADDLGIGTQLLVDDGTGKVFKTTGSPQSKPFVCLEVVTDPSTDQLVWAEATGQ